MALLQPVIEYETPTDPATSPRIRRCTFRRLSRISSDPSTGYEVSCLYPDRRLPLPIGDLDTALVICRSCSASHIFRPDED